MKDTGEQQDLAESQPEKAARLRAAFKTWLRETKLQMPSPNPNFDPARALQAGEPIGR